MKKEMNNKGFSLVELIIVIAIMAVLVGVLAPQYLKYVKNSKVSTDITNASNINTAISAGIADGSISVTSADSTISAISSAWNLSINEFPTSKVDSTFNWSVVVNDKGVKEITLGGKEIFPDAESSGHYKDVNWSK